MPGFNAKYVPKGATYIGEVGGNELFQFPLTEKQKHNISIETTGKRKDALRHGYQRIWQRKYEAAYNKGEGHYPGRSPHFVASNIPN
jgi:hypothetical protein